MLATLWPTTISFNKSGNFLILNAYEMKHPVLRKKTLYLVPEKAYIYGLLDKDKHPTNANAD